MLNIPANSYVIIVERDNYPKDITSRGPLVLETYLPQSLEEAKFRIRELHLSRYGEIRICHLVPVEPETSEAANETL